MVEAMPIHNVSGCAGDSSDLLFLDVDGVLHPVGADYSFSSRFFSHLPLLEELLREFKSIDVIISSDWRRAESIEQLQRYFSADIRHRIIGATPQIDPNVVVTTGASWRSRPGSMGMVAVTQSGSHSTIGP